jgi:hypothetical protein
MDYDAVGKRLLQVVLRAALNSRKPTAKLPKYSSIVGHCIESVATVSVKTAANGAVELNEGKTHISIYYDGSCQKRCHTSETVCAVAASVETGKLLDVEAPTRLAFCAQQQIHRRRKPTIKLRM